MRERERLTKRKRAETTRRMEPRIERLGIPAVVMSAKAREIV